MSDPLAFNGSITPQNQAAQLREPRRESEWTPAAAETFDSAHADYAELREGNPVPWSSSFGGFWAATTYEDIIRVTTDDESFVTSVQNVVPHVPRSTRRPPLHYDPPEHTAYRLALDPAFRASAIRPLSTPFRAVAQRLIHQMAQAGNPDFSRDVAMPYVIACFAIFLAIEEELAARIRTIVTEYSYAIQEMDEPVIAEASAELYAIAEEIYRSERDVVDPESDLIERLRAVAADPATGITEATAIATVRQLIAAGMAAPHATLGSSVAHLARDTQLQEHLRAHPDDIPAAVEEFLRLYAPYRVFSRTAVKDVTLRGRDIRAGEPVALIFPSANRDEAVFADPNEFVLRRPANSHLAFGRGSHKCPAASLGRLQLVTCLTALLEATDSFTLDGEIVMMSWLEYGPRSVPLSVGLREPALSIH